ncbi:hypothetical protein SAMN02910292_02556 [Lachnospiraceae bacterium XBB2008]|nr:hypothetical protein SAMN02910292_02556 [Lachnospiraceae bacterium XBB2008]
MSKSREFSKKAIDNLGYYVYIYSDPDTRIPFYIGKGKGNRCFQHLFLDKDCEKVAKIQEILSQGKEPIIEILVHGVDEETALKVEAATIDLIGIDNLTNIQRGHHSSVYGRIDVDDINLRYDRELLDPDSVTENIIMIRINQNYHYGMSDFEIYEVTRCCWKVNIEQARKVEYALSVYDGIVIECFKVLDWVPAYSTMHIFKQPEETKLKDERRYEFIGNIAEEPIRSKYVGKVVSDLFPKGNQNPIKYILRKEL